LHRLTEEQRVAFRDDGYVAALDVMSREEAEAYRIRVEEFLATVPDPTHDLRTKVHLDCPALLELVRRREILDVVSDVLGPDVLCRSSSLFIKEPHDGGFVAWHQDATYWALESSAVATAWLALSASTTDNGALRVLPGSHRRPSMEHHQPRRAGNLLTLGQELVDPIDEDRAFTLELAPGQMSLHDGWLAHASAPNLSSTRRIGYAIRYLATHVRNIGTRRDSALLVRGVDRYGHFDPEPGSFRKLGSTRSEA
jgi:ectoine hydroxylase-related dioxygenase (phytanoyl-CoA dioxygenase family)